MPQQPNYDDLTQVDPAELERFAKLDREAQWEIIELTRRPAKNPKLSKRDRQVAEARARQFERIMRKGKR